MPEPAACTRHVAPALTPRPRSRPRPRSQGVYRTIEDGKGGIGRGGVKPTRGKTVRQVDEEEEHYWQSRKANRKEENGKRDRSVSSPSPDAEFFSKCRSRMPKPMYLELLKCLNLYLQQIIGRSELLTLVHDLFKRTQIELFSHFRRLPGYSGGDARDAPSPPASRSAPEGGSFRDLDFASMKKHGASYRILPDDYGQPNCSGRGPLEQLVLNDQLVSVATGTEEDQDFKTMRKSQYEESIFRAEDERFELDTTIETNMATLLFLRPIQAELDTMTEPEKRRYKLPTTTLSAMHCKAIRRLYGTQGMQVIELLSKCPAAAINPLVKRLTQKDEEWRGLRTQLAKGWKEVYEKKDTTH
jgi:paired amphipathic helix protein Sin3a